jgi:hypothetical protein
MILLQQWVLVRFPTCVAGCCTGKVFGLVGEDLALHCVTDDQLVQCFKGRRNVAFVFLNGCGTTSVCRRLQLECGIPVVLGWDDNEVPLQQQLAMVCACAKPSACLGGVSAKLCLLSPEQVWVGAGWYCVCPSRTCS